jgi:hypothetical protein
VYVSWSAVSGSASISGAATGGSSQGCVVRVVGKVPACVPGGGDAPLADLQIGIDAATGHPDGAPVCWKKTPRR